MTVAGEEQDMAASEASPSALVSGMLKGISVISMCAGQMVRGSVHVFKGPDFSGHNYVRVRLHSKDFNTSIDNFEEYFSPSI